MGSRRRYPETPNHGGDSCACPRKGAGEGGGLGDDGLTLNQGSWGSRWQLP